jgi:hypothetical protein
MAAGQPGLHGFAPFQELPAQLLRRPKITANIGEPAALVSRARYADRGNEASNARPSWATQPYEKSVGQARAQAAEARSRREAARAALHLPVERAAMEGFSVAPRPRVGVSDGIRVPSASTALPASLLRQAARQRDSVQSIEATSKNVDDAEIGRRLAVDAPTLARSASAHIERALEDYFFRQSRLPPVGGAAFNPLLSPVWAGLKIPG